MTENNSDSNGREEMASKAHAAVQEDEFATANGKKVRIKIFRGDSEGARRSSTRYRPSRGWSYSTPSSRCRRTRPRT